MKPQFDWQDWLLRSLIVAAGGVAALLLAIKGQADALPALAVGGLAGAYLMGSVQRGEEDKSS